MNWVYVLAFATFILVVFFGAAQLVGVRKKQVREGTLPREDHMTGDPEHAHRAGASHTGKIDETRGVTPGSGRDPVSATGAGSVAGNGVVSPDAGMAAGNAGLMSDGGTGDGSHGAERDRTGASAAI